MLRLAPVQLPQRSGCEYRNEASRRKEDGFCFLTLDGHRRSLSCGTIGNHVIDRFFDLLLKASCPYLQLG